jgi:hypothetical protein
VFAVGVVDPPVGCAIATVVGCVGGVLPALGTAPPFGATALVGTMFGAVFAVGAATVLPACVGTGTFGIAAVLPPAFGTTGAAPVPAFGRTACGFAAPVPVTGFVVVATTGGATFAAA